MYKVIVTKPALKELAKIDPPDQQFIFNKIKELKNGDTNQRKDGTV